MSALHQLHLADTFWDMLYIVRRKLNRNDRQLTLFASNCLRILLAKMEWIAVGD